MNTSGIGLGLVISDQLIKKMKGSISFESKENVGSTFTITVKLAESQEQEQEEEIC